MQHSYSERRKARYNKFRKKTSLNLVSLMDIFTILVFFLLVNSSNSQQLPNSKNIKLPDSVADKSPQQTLVIAITAKDIIVEGQRVAVVSEVLNSTTPEDFIPGLKKELLFQYSKSFNANNLQAASAQNRNGQAVTIMGDEKIPYELLKKVLATCRQANYTRIAFGAIQKSKNAKS